MVIRIIILISIICGTLQAQVTEQWVKRYNGAGYSSDGANRIALTSTGNIVVTGYSAEDTSDCPDVCTIMYDQSGSIIWKSTYNGPAGFDDFAIDMTIDVDNNIIITGSSAIIANDFYYALLMKYNSAGVLQWMILDSGGVHLARRMGMVVRTDSDGNIYWGQRHGTNISSTGLLVKFSPGGSLLWQSQTGKVYGIVIGQDGYIYAGGNKSGNYFLEKYSPSGSLIWSDTLKFGPGSGTDSRPKMTADYHNNIYFSGILSTQSGLKILKINTSGNILWQDSNSISASTTFSILSDTSGNAYLAGSKYNFTNYDFCVIKYSSTGSLIWAGIYTGPNSAYDYLTDIAFNKTGQLLATGHSVQNYYGKSDFVTVKFSSNGGISWVKSYNGTADSLDIARCIISDTSGNIFIAGESMGTGTGLDFLTIKYSESVGINESGTEVPHNFFFAQNYPNPFNPKTIINYQLPITIYVKLAVFDITGKEVATLVNEHLQAGKYEATFDGSNLPSGVYLYRLTAGSFAETKRMVMIK